MATKKAPKIKSGVARWKRKMRDRIHLAEAVAAQQPPAPNENLVTMELAPEMRSRLRALMAFSGQENPAVMVSVCIATVHSLMRLSQANDMVVTAQTLQTVLSESRLAEAGMSDEEREVANNTASTGNAEYDALFKEESKTT